jgi:hypothetical protein
MVIDARTRFKSKPPGPQKLSKPVTEKEGQLAVAFLARAADLCPVPAVSGRKPQ